MSQARGTNRNIIGSESSRFHHTHRKFATASFLTEQQMMCHWMRRPLDFEGILDIFGSLVVVVQYLTGTLQRNWDRRFQRREETAIEENLSTLHLIIKCVKTFHSNPTYQHSPK